MGLATTYIVAMFAIFVSLLSFILSSYGGQVTTRSSNYPKNGDKGEDMGLVTTYIVAMFAIFVSLLSFILSSYGGQVTTRSSSHPNEVRRGGHGAGHHLHCCHVIHLCVPSLVHSLLLWRSGNYQILQLSQG